MHSYIWGKSILCENRYYIKIILYKKQNYIIINIIYKPKSCELSSQIILYYHIIKIITNIEEHMFLMFHVKHFHKILCFEITRATIFAGFLELYKI